MKIHSPRESCLWLSAVWRHLQSGRMTREQLEAAQLKKFRKLVTWAQGHSPYYNSLIREHKIDPQTCLPTDFPVMTKSDVVKNFNDLVTDRTLTQERVTEFLSTSKNPEELLDGRYHVLHTSGTSGTMGCFVFSHEAWIKGASHCVVASPLRLRKRVAFVAATRGHFAGVSLMLAGNDGTNRLFFDVRTFDVGQPLERIIGQLNQFQPQVLTGYARVLKLLAEAQEQGLLKIRPKEVGSGGEPLLPDAKAYIERVFGTDVLNGYASSEHLYMAMPLPGSDGMHLLEEDLIFELGPDHTCVTNLFNTTMPLIRYRMEDVLVPDESRTSTYPFTRVKEVIGRHEDGLVFTNDLGKDDLIHPIIIVELVIEGLRGWQIVLEGRTSFRFRALFEAHLTPAQRQKAHEGVRRTLGAILAEKNMSQVRFTIEEVEALETDPKSGKFRLVVQHG